MGKNAVVYLTKNGSTEKYATWIAEDCHAERIPYKEANADRLSTYDTVVYGGCVYGGMIEGISLIKNIRDAFRHTRLIVFTVGLTQPGDEKAHEQILARNFSGEERQRIRFYHFPGALDFVKMSLPQRLMMRILRKSILNKPKERRTQIEEYILQAYGGKIDFTDHRYVKDIVCDILNEGAGDAESKI